MDGARRDRMTRPVVLALIVVGLVLGGAVASAQTTSAENEDSRYTFNRADDFTFPGNIVGDGRVAQSGTGTLTLTGANTYTNGTTINAGTLQVGAGGTTGTINPGILYETKYFQIGAEAIIPVNGASGHDVGAVVQLQIFLDDIWPKIFGHPIIGSDE